VVPGAREQRKAEERRRDKVQCRRDGRTDKGRSVDSRQGKRGNVVPCPHAEMWTCGGERRAAEGRGKQMRQCGQRRGADRARAAQKESERGWTKEGVTVEGGRACMEEGVDGRSGPGRTSDGRCGRITSDIFMLHMLCILMYSTSTALHPEPLVLPSLLFSLSFSCLLHCHCDALLLVFIAGRR